jgi:hypothetical protein
LDAGDWNAEKTEWLQHLDNLYRIVESFLREYIDRHQIIVSYNKTYLTEENIGTYEVRAMALAFGANRLELFPIGTLLIGTKGRVDLKGPRGIVRLILADKNSTGIKIIIRSQVLEPGRPPTSQPYSQEIPKPDWVWKIVATRTPQLTYQDLTQDSLFDAIMAVSNG